jgi:hypothetical protein
VLKERQNGRKDEEEEASSYWMTLTRKEDGENISLCGPAVRPTV